MNLLESLWEDGLRYKKTNNEQYEKILIQILNTGFIFIITVIS